MADFNKAIIKLLKNEGGYVFDPDDPGGETNFGISKRSYPNEDIKNLTPERAAFLYRRDYWNEIRGDKINNQELAQQIFDFGVNSGVKNAVKTFQRLFEETLKIDGVLGEKTLYVISQACKTQCEDILLKYKLARIEYYFNICRKNKVQRKYLYFWVHRTLDLNPKN